MKQVVNNYFAALPQQMDLFVEETDVVQLRVGPQGPNGSMFYLDVNGITIVRLGPLKKLNSIGL